MGARGIGADGGPARSSAGALLAAARRYGGGGADSLSRAAGVGVVAARRRLLSRERAHLAGGGRAHSTEVVGGALARRFLPALSRRRERTARGQALRSRGSDCCVERGRAVRLAQLL